MVAIHFYKIYKRMNECIQVYTQIDESQNDKLSKCAHIQFRNSNLVDIYKIHKVVIIMC